MRVLVITNLFGFPWDPARGLFNQQQFDRLSAQVTLCVLVAVPWTQALRRPRAYCAARRAGRQRWPYVDYFVFWYLPRVARGAQALFFVLSLLLQRPLLLLGRRWHAMLGSWAFPDAVATVALATLTRTPVFMKVHGTDINDYLHEPAKRWQILAAARRCARVFTPSAALRGRLLDAGLEAGRVAVNYNGVDAARFCPGERGAARRAAGMGGEGPLLLFVGNLKFAKGPLDLLEAFGMLAAAHEGAVLAFIGDGEARPALAARAAALGLQGRVHLPGALPHEAVGGWFRAASLVCLPSHAEGVPNVLLEAMACGVPVVATRVGGVAEVVPAFAGILVPPRAPQALAEALLAALSRAWDAERIRAHARGFDWDANVERLLAPLRAARWPLHTPLRPQ